MKKLFLVCMLILAACSADKAHELNASQVMDYKQSLQVGKFEIAQDASMLTVEVLKNESIPVKGALNVRSGIVNLNGGGPLLDLAIDIKSWDSGLTARDSNVTQYFFNVANPANEVAQIKIDSIANDVLKAFKTSGSLDNFKTSGTVTFNGTTVPFDALLNISFDEKGMMVVKTLEKINLKISSLNLSENLTKLIQICEHKSVADDVQVGVFLTFKPSKI